MSHATVQIVILTQNNNVFPEPLSPFEMLQLIAAQHSIRYITGLCNSKRTLCLKFPCCLCGCMVTFNGRSSAGNLWGNLKTYLRRDLSMLLCMVRAAAKDRIFSSRVLLSWNTIWVPETPA